MRVTRRLQNQHQKRTWSLAHPGVLGEAGSLRGLARGGAPVILRLSLPEGTWVGPLQSHDHPGRGLEGLHADTFIYVPLILHMVRMVIAQKKIKELLAQDRREILNSS